MYLKCQREQEVEEEVVFRSGRIHLEQARLWRVRGGGGQWKLIGKNGTFSCFGAGGEDFFEQYTESDVCG